jgi:hypothetical protein
MGNISNKICRENQNTKFTSSNFTSENRAVYEIMSKNMVQPEAADIVAPAHDTLDK